jgi:hypothetical protein
MLFVTVDHGVLETLAEQVGISCPRHISGRGSDELCRENGKYKCYDAHFGLRRGCKDVAIQEARGFIYKVVYRRACMTTI